MLEAAFIPAWNPSGAAGEVFVGGCGSEFKPSRSAVSLTGGSWAAEEFWRVDRGKKKDVQSEM